MTTSDVTERRILEWIEQLFSQPPEALKEIIANLTGAVPVAHDLFGESAVGALVEGARCEPFSASCLTVLASLVEYRQDLDDRLIPVAADALRTGHCLEESCAILAPQGRKVDSIDADLVALVVAIDALAWNTNWLTEAQMPTVLDLACGWVVTYREKKQFWDVEPQIELVLALSRRLPSHRLAVIRWLTNLFPNDVELFDRKLLDKLVRNLSPREAGASLVAVRIGEWLSGRNWKPFESNEEWTKWIVWLQRLKITEFRVAESALRDAALRSARHNPLVASLVASVFAGFGRFAVEAEIVGAIRAALPEGRLHARQLEALKEAGRAAEENSRRVGS